MRSVLIITGKSLKGDNLSFLLIGVKVREQDPVSQCFKCQRFDHKAAKCRFKIEGKPSKRCSRCGCDHDLITEKVKCTATPCCFNCKDRTRFLKDKSQCKTDYEANDDKCPERILAIKRARELIKYEKRGPDFF